MNSNGTKQNEIPEFHSKWVKQNRYSADPLGKERK
jgi:hypothetical protein